MRCRIWFAYATISSPVLSATLPKAATSEEHLNTSPLSLALSANVSTAMTDTLQSTKGSNLLLPLNDTFLQTSNYSSSYDLPSTYGLGVPTSTPQCSKAAYGRIMDRFSCFDAWRNLGAFPQREAWGPRGGQAPGVKGMLPARWSSGKSDQGYWYCVILRVVDSGV